MKKILYSLLGTKYTWLAIQYNQLKTLFQSYCSPYHYDEERYLGTFLDNANTITDEQSQGSIDRIIYVFWTGDNEITPNRMKGLNSLERCSGVKVKLITTQNLHEYIKEEDPLPEAYQYLSLNHKSDYLRSYFMYHYGGGYADIKIYYHSWASAFDKLEQSEAYAIGYREVGFWGAANQSIESQKMKDDLRTYWRLLIGNGAFICRPYTKLTAEWHAEAKRRLMENVETLRLHPAKDFFGSNPDYPLPWASMQGEIFHPLCLKYHDKLLVDNSLKPSFKNYR